MVSLAGMLSHTTEKPGLWQAAFRNPNGPPPGLNRALANSIGPNISLDDARSFTSQLIVERISVRLTSVFTEAPAQETSSPLDFSPDATAQRIFSFSINMFAVYQAQNPDEPLESALTNFEQIVRDAIDEGFGEARGILEELGRLDEQTAEFVDNAYSVLDRLLDAFFRQDGIGEESEPAGPATGSYWAAIEFEYQYLHLEASSVSQTSTASDAGAFSLDFTRIHIESLSVVFSQGGLAPEPTLQVIA